MGDATKAKEELGWIPKMRFKELVKEMVEADVINKVSEALEKKEVEEK